MATYFQIKVETTRKFIIVFVYQKYLWFLFLFKVRMGQIINETSKMIL